MGSAQTSMQQMWDTTSSGYKFYGIIDYSCSRNNDDNTYTVRLNKLRVHGKSWNFAVNYFINIGGTPYSGTIPTSGSAAGEKWLETVLNIPHTVDGDSEGKCPAINLSYTIYNDKVWYINKQRYVSFSSSYSENIGPTVQKESGGPNSVWKAAGGATVKSITENPDEGKAVVVTEMGADGKNNKVSDVHLYYSFSNTNPQYKGADVYGLSNGDKSDRTVTFTIPYSTVKERTTIYARAFSISEHEDNPGGAVVSKSLVGWDQCDGSVVERITDNKNNTFTVTTRKGSGNRNNSVTDVQIYYSYRNQNPKAGGSNCEGLSKNNFNNIEYNNSKVIYYNIPIEDKLDSSGNIWVRARSIAAKGNNQDGEVERGILKYYHKPTLTLAATPKGKRAANIVITETTKESDWEYYYSTTSAKLDTVSGSGVKSKYVATLKLTDCPPDTVTTYYFKARRETGAAESKWCMSSVKSVKVDLRCPKITTFETVDTNYEGWGKFKVKAYVDSASEKLDYKISNAKETVIVSGQIPNNKTTYIETSKLTTSALENYTLTVSRPDCKDLDVTAVTAADTRWLRLKDVRFRSGLANVVDANEVPDNLSEEMLTLHLTFRTLDAYKAVSGNKSEYAECDGLKVTLYDITDKKTLQLKETTIERTDNVQYTIHPKDGLQLGHTYEIRTISIRYVGNSHWFTESNFTQRPRATVGGNIKVRSKGAFKTASVWIYDDKMSKFKSAVPYVYTESTNTWYRVFRDTDLK